MKYVCYMNNDYMKKESLKQNQYSIILLISEQSFEIHHIIKESSTNESFIARCYSNMLFAGGQGVRAN